MCADLAGIHAASQRSLEVLLSKAPPRRGQVVMDMGSAYGNSARFIASNYGAAVHCIDLSGKGEFHQSKDDKGGWTREYGTVSRREVVYEYWSGNRDCGLGRVSGLVFARGQVQEGCCL